MTDSHINKIVNFARYWRKARSTEFKNLPIMFSYEKIFTVDGGLNSLNQRVYAISRDEADKNGRFFINFIKIFNLIFIKEFMVDKKPPARNGLDQSDCTWRDNC